SSSSTCPTTSARRSTPRPARCARSSASFPPDRARRSRARPRPRDVASPRHGHARAPRPRPCWRDRVDRRKPAPNRHETARFPTVRSTAGGGWSEYPTQGGAYGDARETMDLGLRGRTAIVCGASSGIGLAAAESLAGEGANVVMFARRRELLEREAERIGGPAGGGGRTHPPGPRPGGGP